MSNLLNCLEQRKRHYNDCHQTFPKSFLIPTFDTKPEWNTKTKTDSQINCFQYHPLSHEILVTGNEHGNLGLYLLKEDTLEGIDTYQAPRMQSIFDLFVHGHKTTFSLGNGKIFTYDIPQLKVEAKYSFHKTTCKLLSNLNEHLFCSYGKDHYICIWDNRHSEPVLKKEVGFIHQHFKKGDRPLKRRKEISGLLFQDEHQILTSFSQNSLLESWDLRNLKKPSQQFQLPSEKGICHLSQTEHFITVTSRENQIYVLPRHYLFDHQHLQIYTAPTLQCDSYLIQSKMSPCEQFIASGSDKGGLNLWSVKQKHFVYRLMMENDDNSPVYQIAWDSYSEKVINDYKYKIAAGMQLGVQFWKMDYNLRNISDNPLISKEMIYYDFGNDKENIYSENNEKETPRLHKRRRTLLDYFYKT